VHSWSWPDLFERDVMTDEEIMAASERLLRPYRIPKECPYLSEEQRELSMLDIKGRSAWMAEWLVMASSTSGRRGGPPPPC
jgi:hypothetical protein